MWCFAFCFFFFFFFFFFFYLFSFGSYAGWLWTKLRLGGGIPIFMGRGGHLILHFVHFVTVLLYLSIFPFGVGGLMWI